jgi:hypothetical protein
VRQSRAFGPSLSVTSAARDADAEVPNAQAVFEDIQLEHMPLSEPGLRAVASAAGWVQFRVRPEPPTNGNGRAEYVVVLGWNGGAGGAAGHSMAAHVNASRDEWHPPRVSATLCATTDACPADGNKTDAGVCGCGVQDVDTDGDGSMDCVDACPADDSKTADAGVCGCGTPEGDTDGDGVADCVDECTLDAKKSARGVCGCGVDDSDTDGDGFVCDDACPTDAAKSTAGVCGCGVPDTASNVMDSDGDGASDCVDDCPADAAATVRGPCGCPTGGAVTAACASCFRWGYATVRLALPDAGDIIGDPFLHNVSVAVVLPDATTRVVAAFYDGTTTDAASAAAMLRYDARVYCGQAGVYTWHVVSSAAVEVGSGSRSGTFDSRLTATPAGWKGKLRQHPLDGTQFVYDNGEDFVHIGDTAYRLLVDTELHWKQYLRDAATVVGVTKVRVWLATRRKSVATLFEGKESAPRSLSLPTWQGFDARIRFALEHYPWLQLQLILYGEDDDALKLASRGNEVAAAVPTYAQARWSALANVHFCIVNDRMVPVHVTKLGNAMAAREPWGTLLTRYAVAVLHPSQRGSL